MFPTAKLDPLMDFQGITRRWKPLYDALKSLPCQYLQRLNVEDDPAYTQILTYVITLGKDMIFTLAEQIAQLSNGMTLHPGDVILTGTPAGVGSARGEFLKPGDTVKIWIEKIGTLTNKMA